MSRYHSSPIWVFGSLWAHRNLVWQMTRREVLGRYRGSLMGLLWSFLYPLLMLAVYTFVFSAVFKARWSEAGGTTEFAAMVFAGMIVHGLFAECVVRAPQSVLGNPNYVKKVVFPLEVLPWITMGSALFHALVSTAVLVAFNFLANGQLPWTVFLFPLVLMPLVLFTLGASWFLASLGVYLRDVAQVAGILTTILLFLSPVFYPASALPERYRPLFELNPLTPAIEFARGTLLRGDIPDWRSLVYSLIIGFALAWAGLAWFQRARRGFADVL